MTLEEAKRKLADICADIVNQNRELISAMDAPDFDPAIRLDNTKNNAAYKLTDFFDILKCFPYGRVPHEVTNELISSTDELLQKIRKKYGTSQEVLRQIILAGQAFRNSKRIWRIKDPIKDLPQETYEKKLDDALYDILHTLDNLNYELHLMQNEPPPAPAPKPRQKRRGHVYGEKDSRLHKERATIVAEMRRRKAANKALSWAKIAASLRTNSSYAARMRDKTDATWIRYAKAASR